MPPPPPGDMGGPDGPMDLHLMTWVKCILIWMMQVHIMDQDLKGPEGPPPGADMDGDGMAPPPPPDDPSDDVV